MGDDVKTAPQFQENLPSFAVAYGLGVQGLEPERAAHQPAAARDRAGAADPRQEAVGAGGLGPVDAGLHGPVPGRLPGPGQGRQRAVPPGCRLGQERDRRKGRSTRAITTRPRASGRPSTTLGQSLVIPTGDRGKWAKFLQQINAHLPDPVRDYKLDPNKAADQPKLDRLRVHIDAIKPVWRKDVAADWFNTALRADFKNLMHQIDRATPPSGEGWIVQIVGHHYNPNPTAEELKLPPGQQTAFGPYQYLTRKILPSLLDPALRVEGVNHVALAWMTVDRAWTTDKGATSNGLTSTPVPLLARASPPAGPGG